MGPDEEPFWLHRDQFESAPDSVVGRVDFQITFDDGNASDLEHALPQLRRRGLTTYGLTTGPTAFLDDPAPVEVVVS